MGVSSLGRGAGTASPTPIGASGTGTSTSVYNTAAPSVNTPLFFEPTAALLTAWGLISPELIIGLSGGPGGVFSPLWGGASVYASLDDASYGLASPSTFSGPSVMGSTTSDTPATGTSIAVNLAESDGTLASVSSANSLTALCVVQTSAGLIELVTFTAATLTGPSQYTLTGLSRGLYGTSPIDLPGGSLFLFLGAGIFWRATLPAQFVGQEVWFKFPSFNLLGPGNGAQLISDATAYPVLFTGSSVIPGLFPIHVVSDSGIPAEIHSMLVQADSALPIEAHPNILVMVTANAPAPIEAGARQIRDTDPPVESIARVTNDTNLPTENR